MTTIETTTITWEVNQSYEDVLDRIRVVQMHNMDFIELTRMVLCV